MGKVCVKSLFEKSVLYRIMSQGFFSTDPTSDVTSVFAYERTNMV